MPALIDDAKSELFERAAVALGGDADAALAFFIPGRIECLGKHTDYCGGRSIVCPIERGLCILAVPREDDRFIVIDAMRDARFEATLSPELIPQAGHWSNYPATVARRVARNFGARLKGATIAIASDLPMASGMSSSSAVIVGVFMALSQINQLDQHPAYVEAIHTPEHLAEYLGTIENGQSYRHLAGDRGVGTFGGSEDHTAILCGTPGHLSVFRYCPTTPLQTLQLPDAWSIVIGCSGVVAEKGGAARDRYNRAALLAGELAQTWARLRIEPVRPLASIIHEHPDAADRFHHWLRTDRSQFPMTDMLNRLRQLIEEELHVIPAVIDLLARGQIDAIGPWVDRSQFAVENWLGNQIPQTTALARIARELGATAASAFGAGFGGSVWALVRSTDAADFANHWLGRYLDEFPAHAAHATCFATRPGAPAQCLAVTARSDKYPGI